MNIMSPVKPPKRRVQMQAILLAFLSAAGVGLYFLLRGGSGAQRVLENYPQSGQTLAQAGIVYSAIRNPNGDAIAQITAFPVTPVARASVRLAPESMPLRLDGSLYPGKGALYGMQFRSFAPKRADGSVNVRLSGPIPADIAPRKSNVYLGAFALTAPPPAVPPAGESWAPSPTFNAEKGEATLWRLPEDGSAARKIVLDTKGIKPLYWHLSPAENAFLWVRSRLGKTYDVSTKSGYYQASPNDDELWLSPLDGGPAQLIASGISDNTQFYGNKRIIAYQQRSAYPDATLTLHCRRIAEGAQGKEALLKNYPYFEPPVEFQGRLYWIEPEPDGAEAVGTYNPDVMDPSLQNRIVSESWEGDDRRIVVPSHDAQGEARSFRLLRLSGDRLYTVYAMRPATKNKDGIAVQPGGLFFVARLHPDTVAAMGTPSPLPPGSGDGILDGDYLYFPVHREERNWGTSLLDLFSTNTVSGQITNALYRLPLPE